MEMGQDDPRLGLTRTWAETDEISLAPRQSAEGGLARGASLGRYVVLECLGAGAMGIVFAAYDPELDRRVAVKVLHMRGAAEASSGRARLLREAQAMARLSHPNVVTVHDVGTFEGDLLEEDGLPRVFVAMEFVEGITLAQWLEQESRWWQQVLDVLVPVARALQAIHTAGVVHRDVKPDNIMVGNDGRVRLMDLGLARPVETGKQADPRELRSGEQNITASTSQPPEARSGESQPKREFAKVTRLGAIAGTPAYMAPEQYLRGDADAKSDQYSFCVTLFEALYRMRPYEGGSLHELAQKIVEGKTNPVPRDTVVPRWLQEIVARGMRADPAQRFAGMDELVAELTRERRRTGRRGGVFAALAIAGVVAWRALAPGGDDDACAAAGTPMTDTWNDRRREAIHAAFVSTGAVWAGDTATRAFGMVDEYADTWTAMRVESCRQSSGRDDGVSGELALRDACLDERLAELDAWLDVLTAADRKVLERAVGATGALSPIGQCADRAYLAARQRPYSDREVGEQVAELRGALGRVRALEWAGRYEDGIVVARDVVATAEALGERPLLAEAEYRLAEVQNGAGKYGEAEATLVSAFAHARWSRHELAASDAATLLAYVVGVNEGRYDDALLWARIAEAELGPTGQDTERHASLLNNLGNIHRSKGDYEKAREHLDQAIAITTALYGPDHLLVAKYRGNLVPVLSSLGRAEEAVTMGNEVMRIQREQLGPDHPYIAIAHNNVCSAIYSMRDVDSAVSCFEEALGEQQRAFGENHPQVALTLNNLGAMRHVEGRDDAAYDYLARARKVFAAAYPPDHPHIGGVELNLGACALALGRNTEAVEHMRAALENRKKNLGEDHSEVAEARAELADALIADGHPDQALAELEAALAVVETRLGPDVPFVARIRARRGLVWAALDRPAIATRELESTLAVMQTDERGDGEIIARTQLELARLYWADGKRDRARAAARDAVAAYRDVGGRGRAGLARAESWLAAHESE
jgi:tetratricopeptide (TPR) repeat protein